jgi:hypothetical protein
MHAISGNAGINLTESGVHDYGVDLTLRPVVLWEGKRIQSGTALDVQLKATTDWTHEGADVVYDLEARAFNSVLLRGVDDIPKVVAVLCLPKARETWVSVTESEIVLRHCCYWYIPEGEPTDNQHTVRVKIPRANLLTTESLADLVRSVQRGGGRK